MASQLRFTTPLATIDFQRSVAANFKGYRLLSYAPGTGIGATGSVADTIVCDIHGTSVDDALAKLQLLKQLVYLAPAQLAGQDTLGPPNVSFQPEGSTNISWSILMGGSVSEGKFDFATTKGVISNVIVTIQREPYWRVYLPQYYYDITTLSKDIYSTNVKSRGKFTLSTPVTGNLPAMAHVRFGPSAATVGPWDVKLAYVSAQNNPIGYDQYGNYEGESCTLNFASSVADAAAENGTCAQTPSGTATTTIISKLLNQRGGTFRVYARMRCSAVSTRWDAYAAATTDMSLPFTTPVVNGGVTAQVTSNAYSIFDLGPISFPNGMPAFDNYSAWPTTVQINAGRVSGAGLLNIDWIYLMPIHEYYIENDVAVGLYSSLIYDNILPTPRNISGGYSLNSGRPYSRTSLQSTRGVMRFPPGIGSLYWYSSLALTGGTDYAIAARCVPVYAAPRGAGV